MIIHLTASALKAVLCFIDPESTPKIAYDKDKYALILIEKIKITLQDKDGSTKLLFVFHKGEEELLRQFNGVCKNIKKIFNNIEHCTAREVVIDPKEEGNGDG